MIFDASKFNSITNSNPGKPTFSEAIAPLKTKMQEGFIKPGEFFPTIKEFREWRKKNVAIWSEKAEAESKVNQDRKNLAVYNEFRDYANANNLTDTKANFSKFVKDAINPDTPDRVEIVRKTINEYIPMKKSAKALIKEVGNLPTGEGGEPKAPVGKNAEKYAGNVNLETISDVHRPFVENIVRYIGDFNISKIREGGDWESARKAVNPKYVAEQLRRVFDTEDIIMKDGTTNPELRINQIDVVGYNIGSC